MKILAVETATEACSAALLVDGGILERFRVAPREHTRLILPMVDSLLDEAGFALGNLDALAFGRGPGSFTGVRIAAGIIQGLALGADLPVVPVSTLASLAQHYLESSDCATIFTALDARMGEVYWGVYQKDSEGLARLAGKEAVLPAIEVQFSGARIGKGAGLGSGWAAYRDILTERLNDRVDHIDPECYPHASSVALLGQDGYLKQLAVAPEQALPVYLRDTVARKKCE
ncbi:MAG: tRNA (adenosine(37)-N6)-threonylcarbamoyltransferase complex dimerization subunit type 1 TsaB [Methylococcaceae bacterium]|nr:tRNA (adenosine(37)-N6)-threonylcarbamoyltransferase complex dimerization subunit type 1 TsaB [Methylococcaceae bacterium]MCI0733709.1 tRNA (adenosine(37)-N6)-threonylcarbamoyltransferase complex dimerization subunit type 1 TsaB [Methylococcaceae bacterium]